ncbi:hypothetical protein D9M71_742660 [compost metagenome]
MRKAWNASASTLYTTSFIGALPAASSFSFSLPNSTRMVEPLLTATLSPDRSSRVFTPFGLPLGTTMDWLEYMKLTMSITSRRSGLSNS